MDEYPPPCPRHAERVVRTAGCLLDLQPLAGNPSGIPDFLLDLQPASSVRESDRFKKELTESQFSQRSGYPRKSANATNLTRNRLF